MENISLSLVLDGVIVVLLIATIIYAARLSLYLKKFKDSRDELEGIITNLSKHIDKADKAVHELHTAVDESSGDLQARMNRAKDMFDDLDLVVQTGDSLANRLEELAVRNRRIMDGGEGDLSDLQNMTEKTEYDNRLEKIVKSVKGKPAEKTKIKSPFSIRDPEIENGGLSDGGFTLDDNEVLSDAERDLYDALQRNKTKQSGGA